MASFVVQQRSRLALALLASLLALGLPSQTKAGLPAPSVSASSCETNPRQVFLPWGDTSYYALVPGGSFEGTHGWSLKGGAKIVAGNEPFYVGNRGDKSSLYLPAGSSATSPPTCFAFADWHARYFAVSRGSQYGALEVDVLVKGLLGVVSVLDGGTIRAGAQWAPTPKISLLLTNVGGLLFTDTISLRFTPVGNTAAFEIDDVYLDPYKGD